MKIIYLAEYNFFEHSGVSKKILMQHETWLKFGVDCELIVLSPQKNINKKNHYVDLDKKIHVISYYQSAYFGFILNKLIKTFALIRLKNKLSEFKNYIIYYRQSSWTPGFCFSISSASRMYMEINTDDIKEVKLRYSTIFFHLYKLTRKFLINKSHGFVFVTHQLQKNFSISDKKTIVIGNGFKVDNIQPRGIPQNKDINVIFVGTQNLPWHGIDILFEISKRLQHITFHIVGATGNEHKSTVNNVILYPYLDGANLKKIYNIIDVGISSLALFRNEMTDACPLKSREYLSYGIPVIGAYKDPDLSGFDFYLELPNSHQGILNSIYEIEKFIIYWKGKSIDRKVVNQIIGLDNKELKRIEFLNSL